MKLLQSSKLLSSSSQSKLICSNEELILYLCVDFDSISSTDLLPSLAYILLVLSAVSEIDGEAELHILHTAKLQLSTHCFTSEVKIKKHCIRKYIYISRKNMVALIEAIDQMNSICNSNKSVTIHFDYRRNEIKNFCLHWYSQWK